MSQSQQKADFPKTLSVEALPLAPTPSDTPQIEPEATWEPYLDLMRNWERADAACTKATERANATRKAGEDRVRSTFETEKSQLAATYAKRTQATQAEKKVGQDEAYALLKQVTKTEKGVRRALGTVGLETLMDGIQVQIVGERGDEHTTLQALEDSVGRSAAIDEALQDDLFALRAARQRQSAQMWAVGIGLWLIAAVAFAPYAPITALLVGLAVFVMATPRKTGSSDAVHPSFAEHIEHCVALLFGKQQVMQYPFSLVEKGRGVSGVASGGALATILIAWIFFGSRAPIVGYELVPLAWHLGLVGVVCGFAGVVTFAMANQQLTLEELSEGSSNKILR